MHAGGAVVDRAHHHRGERLGDHPRREHLLDGDGVVGLAVAPRAERAVVPVLGGDGGEGLGRRAVVVHAPLRPQREVGGRQDGGVELVATGAAARRARPPISVILSKPIAMATSARPDATAHAASRNATSPVADAFSTWVTGSPVSPSSFIAFTPSIDFGWT